MQTVRPPGVTAHAFERALAAMADVVGDDWVLATDEDRHTYLDPYAPGDADTHAPSAAVAPSSTEEVQAIVRIANEYGIPLWPVSRGKNLGYGGAAPVMAGTLVLDMGRMNRIIEVNEDLAYCRIEPGVGFFDLFNHLQENEIPLWMSVPGQAWGSVMGNALERGYGYTPYGIHSEQICGMEMVLPNGEIMRTGMGAMADSASWSLFKYGFGPSWDQMFVQSNFGIVTQMGLWLMPEPSATLTMHIELPNAEDLGWLIDVLCPLRRRGIIAQQPSIGSWRRSVSVHTQRDEWYQGEGAIPEEIAQKIRDKYGLGWWNLRLTLFGEDEINEVNARIIKEALARHTDQEFAVSKWHRGEPIENSGAGIPSVLALQSVNWHGGRGGHVAFSPVLPASGKHALDQFHRSKKRFDEYGFDFYGSYTLGERHINHISIIFYDRDDADMTRRVRELFPVLVKEAHAAGYGEYRTHLSFMDTVADTYDFNDHALRRLNETVKDTLDPNGILAPGRNGIWPRTYREG